MSEKILDFLTQAANGNALEAEQTFKELISQKVQDRLEDIRADVMFKEEVEIDEETLDELSKKTLGSYVKKASYSLSAHSMNMGAGPNKALHPADRDADYKKSRNVVTKRLKGLQNVAKRVTKENAELMGLELSEEELDELSKKTLGSYVNKSSKSLRDAEKNSNMETFQKRDKGIKKAIDKYTQK